MEIYRCNWLVRNFYDTLISVLDTTARLGGRISVGEPNQDELGFYHLWFFMEIVSNGALAQFVEMVGKQWGLISWQLIATEDELTSYHHRMPLMPPQLHIDQIVALKQAIEMYSRLNEAKS